MTKNNSDSIINSDDLFIQALDILESLTDEDECSFDHHGYCQAHGWFDIETKCPHKRAKDLLKKCDKLK